jgi:hypothetical protein
VFGVPEAGKTLYLWGLLFRLRERLPRSPNFAVAAMFEDDESFAIYQQLTYRLLRDRKVPDPTQLRRNSGPPVVVRLLGGRGGEPAVSNLVFYDPPGEYSRTARSMEAHMPFLAESAGILCLIDPTTPSHEEVLSTLDRHLMAAAMGKEKPRKPLALVLSKCDQILNGELLKPGADCRKALIGLGKTNLVSMAHHHFNPVKCFAISSLGQNVLAPGGRLTQAPEPIGVEDPLLWLLEAVG